MRNLIILFFLAPLSSFGFRVIQYEPIVKYNSSKSHYLVSLPESKASRVGITGVFDAKTKQLAFTTDTYFHDGFIFLSANGERLIQVQLFTYEKKEYCFLNTITKDGPDLSLQIFSKSEINALGSSISNIVDLYSEKNQLIIETTDSTYTISTETLTSISKVRFKTQSQTSFVKFASEFVSNDDFFSISKLLVDGIPLNEKLLKDLGSQTDYKYILIKINFRVTSSGEIEIETASVMIRPPENTEETNLKRKELRSKTIALLQSYDLSKYAMPDEFEHWHYYGSILFAN